MADYVIGDVQGCFQSLMSLLNFIKYDQNIDRLLFVGDLVNRGPKSLDVLLFIKALKIKPIVVLGNHDLYLLYRLFIKNSQGQQDDTIDEILYSDYAVLLGNWLREQKLLYFDKQLNVLITHAGFPPVWTIKQAKSYAKEVENILISDNFIALLENMFGHEPHIWSNSLTGWERIRCIINYFTRMRFCDAEGGLDFSYKGDLNHAPPKLLPWYSQHLFKPLKETVVFGHWASLNQLKPAPNVFALDSGCVWGESLTALRLQDKKIFSVRAQE